MIRKISFKNFYSFKDEQTISFLSKKKETYDYFLSLSTDYINKVAGFIGANASGKTNIMRLFSFLSYFICQSSNEDAGLPLETGFKTFFYDNKPSIFRLEFELEKYIFEYHLEVDNYKVKNEKLYVKKLNKRTRRSLLLNRDNEGNFSLNKNYFEGFKIKFIKNIRPDVSLIAFLKAHYEIEIINLIYSFFFSFKTNINERGELNNVIHQIKTLDMYLKDPDIKESVERFIKKFDLGLNSFDIKLNSGRISVQGLHESTGGMKKLDFAYESRGTQSLFFTLANIFSALKHNSIVVIDEIEAGLHPEALSKLISYFIQENSDGRAQMLFSSHSLGFMNKFDMHQIYITDKDKKNRSTVYRLNQIKDIRSDENFQNKYMSGAYGGFPEIRV